MPKSEAPFLRFLKSYSVDDQTGCWIWQGHIGSVGYGALKAFGQMRDAHRFSFELYKGPIAEGLCILHSCDNKKCVNPDHLKAGTHKENIKDALDRGRIRVGKNSPMFGKQSTRRGIKSSQSKPVLVLGMAFGSQHEAEKALSLGRSSVRYWLKTGNDKAKKISREEYDRYVEQGLAYRPRGIRPGDSEISAGKADSEFSSGNQPALESG